MSRKIGKKKIKTTLEKGRDTAFGFIADNPDIESLSEKFDAVVKGVRACLDNFEQNKFIERGHQQAKTGFLKIMLLGAFEGIQAAHYIEQAIQGRKPLQMMIPSKASALQIELLKAVTVYRTNGKNDFYAFDVQRGLTDFMHRNSLFSPGPQSPKVAA